VFLGWNKIVLRRGTRWQGTRSPLGFARPAIGSPALIGRNAHGCCAGTFASEWNGRSKLDSESPKITSKGTVAVRTEITELPPNIGGPYSVQFP
jgi:hypothetical protein